MEMSSSELFTRENQKSSKFYLSQNSRDCDCEVCDEFGESLRLNIAKIFAPLLQPLFLRKRKRLSSLHYHHRIFIITYQRNNKTSIIFFPHSSMICHNFSQFSTFSIILFSFLFCCFRVLYTMRWACSPNGSVPASSD